MSGNLLKALAIREIAPFIEWKKLAESKEFAVAAFEALVHFREHGDTSTIRRLVLLLSEQKAFKGTLLWACEMAGLAYSHDKSGLVLRRDPDKSPMPATSSLLDLVAFQRTHPATLRQMWPAPPDAALPRQPQFSRGTRKKGRSAKGKKGGGLFVQGGAPGLGKRSS